MDYILLPNWDLSFHSYASINEFYSFIIFTLQINVDILLLNCLVLELYICIQLFSLFKHYLDLNITDTVCSKVSCSLYSFTSFFMMSKLFPCAVGYGHLEYYFSINFQTDIQANKCMPPIYITLVEVT